MDLAVRISPIFIYLKNTLVVMKAVILAAGRGSRLTPITNHIHKTLLNVGEYSILESQIKKYYAQGVRDIFIVVGYRHDEIEEQIVQLEQELPSDLSLNSIHSSIWDQSDNLYSLYLAEEYVRGDSFVLSNGDVFADEEIFERLCHSPEEAIIPYDSTEFDPEELKLKIVDGKPIEILDKGKKNGDGSTIGMFKFDEITSEKLFSDIESHIEIESEQNQWFESSLDRILPYTKFIPVDVSGQNWAEIDTEDDLKDAWSKWANNNSNLDGYLSEIGANSSI